MKYKVPLILFVFILLTRNAHADSSYVRAQGDPLKAQLREWSVTFKPDLVLITNAKKKANCKIDVDNVIGGFWLQNTVLIFESGNAVEDYLSFVDGNKCQFLKRVELAVEEPLRKKRLQLLHLSDK